MPRKKWLVGGLTLGLALAAGHVLYWYQPRERAGAPDPGDLPARLLADPQAGFAIWLPYPHQNLGAAAEELGDLEPLAAALARRSGRDRGEASFELPRFGPFPAPPAREIGAAWGETGEVVVAARVFPALAILAKLAGKVGGNPWLAGGAVEMDGRPATVEWQGSLWIARSAGARLPLDRGRAESEDAGPRLAAFRLGPGAPPLPSGSYLVRRRPDGGFEAVLTGSGLAPELPPGTLGNAGTALLLVRGAARPEWSKPYATSGALALSSRISNAGLPGSAVFALPEDEPWKLPARGLAELLSGDPVSAETAGLRVVASDGEGLAAGETIAPAVAPWLGSRRDELVLGLWLDPGAARKALGDATRLVDDLPFLGHRREAEALADWRTLLGPLEGFDELSIVTLENPPRAWITLTPRPSGQR